MDIIPPLKRCTKCGQEFPPTTEYFYAHAGQTSGLRPDCKRCNNDRKQKYRHTDPEAQNERERRYRSHWTDKYRQMVRERIRIASRSYHRRNREAKIVAMRIRYYADPEKERARTRRYKQAHPEVRREGERRYRQSHGNIKAQKRRARQRNLVNDLTIEQWHNALAYFNNCCAVCGCQAGLWHVIVQDHWIPIAKGGGTTALNIIPLCHSKTDGQGGCNNQKHHQNAAEWLVKKYGESQAGLILNRIEAYFESLIDG